MSYINEVGKLIEKRLTFYRDYREQIIKDYNDELEISKEYKGRQLLELLQNVDDTGSKEAEITWNRTKKSLTIANKGGAFSLDGVNAVMQGHLSTKIKTHFIGNKGLGFRSLLNWARKINVYTNDCKISFSPAHAQKIFNQELGLTEIQKNELTQSRGLKDGSVLFPTLAIPEITEQKNNTNWLTIVEIKYEGDDIEKNIKTQLDQISEELLLFLNHINSIKINIEGQDEILFTSKRIEHGTHTKITINNKEWIVFEKKKILPQRFQDQNKAEQQAYQLKVAFQQDLSDTYFKLFNFFPTQLTVSLPCVIHGTFDLSSSRDHLNRSDVNVFIFKKLVKLLKKCSLFLTVNKHGWEAFKVLTPKNYKSDSELVTDFYRSLEQIRNRIKICPTISDNYVTQKKARYYNDNFSVFFKENFPEIFPELLEPVEDDFRNQFRDSEYPIDKFVGQIDVLSHNGIHIEQRAELIELLVELKNHFTDYKFSLLISQTNKKVILKNITTFTPVVRSDADFEIPNDVEVDFIHTELYDSLLRRFQSKFDQSEKNDQKSRQLQRLIRDVVNLQPYDSNNVIDKIITATNLVVKNTENVLAKNSLVKSMVKALFANFSNIKTEVEVIGKPVYLLNKNNEVAEASTLFISNTYPNGKRVEEIYNGVLTGDDYLTDFTNWNLLTTDLNKVASFFLWLGVNKYLVKGIDELYGLKLKQEYMDRLFSKSIPKPQDFSINKIQSGNRVKHIKNIEHINSLEINKLLLLVLSDRFIKEELEVYNEKIIWKHHINYSLQATISYLQFQFLNYDKFSTQIIGESSEGINSLLHKENFIDFEMMATYGFDEHEVKSILLKLGAKQSINEFSPDALYELLIVISRKFSKANVRGVQNMYHLIVEALSYNSNEVLVPDDLLLFAQIGETIELMSPSEIYYSSNSVLPKKIEDTIPMLLFSKRRNQENLKQYLGIQIIDASQLVVKDKLINNELNILFQQRFESLKPAILTYRLFSKNLRKPVAKADSKTSGVEPLKKCNIILVSQCTYAYGDREDVDLDDFDFVVDGNNYYLKVTKLNSLEELLKESNFSDAFAEIMSIQFKISELKNDFRFLIRNDLSDTKHLIQRDFAKEDLDAIQHHFGIAQAEMTFWKQVYRKAKLDYPESILKQSELIGKLKVDLGIKFGDIYTSVDFVRCTSQESYDLLKLIVGKYSLKVKELYPNGILEYHTEKLRNLRASKDDIIEKSIWDYLNTNKEEQSNFIFYLNSIKEYKTENLFEDEDSFNLKVDYQAIFNNLINNALPFVLDEKRSLNVIINNLYSALLNEFKIEINMLPLEIKSLLYFKGNEIAIKEYLKEEGEENSKDNDENVKKQGKEETIVLGFKEVTLKNKKTKKHRSNKSSKLGKNRRGVHSKETDRQNTINGKNAEIEALKSFKKEYEKVKWVSGFSDTPLNDDNLHYDITYEDENGVWRHVEVKSLSNNNTFILTQAEKEHGIKYNNIYEFALVSKTEIYRVFSPLSFVDGEYFESNKSFTAVAKDYSLYFNIKKV